MRIRAQWVVPCVQAASVWPVWLWLAGRLKSSEHAFCMTTAIAGVAFIVLRERKKYQAEELSLPLIYTAVVLMSLYVVLTFFTPTFISAFPAIVCTALLSVASCVPISVIPVSVWGLVLLILPTVPVLQEFVGYPMRVIATYIAASLLSLQGLSIHVRGVGLGLGTETVLVDAACSGIRMLWTMAFVCFLLSGLYRLRWSSLIVACGVTALLVLIANAIRVTALFYIEAGLAPFRGDLFHAGIGLVIFVLAVLVQIGGIRWLASRQNA